MKLAPLSIATVIAMVVTADLLAGEPEFVGNKKCKVCHFKQYRSWKETKMASSFENLKPGVAADAKKAQGLDPDGDYTADSECLPCHTTGYGNPGGFVSVEETPDLSGVGCEACHGPASEYLQIELMSLKNKNHSLESVRRAGLIYPTTEETCMSKCHNEESPFVSKDQKFDYIRKKSQGVHESLPLKYKHE